MRKIFSIICICLFVENTLLAQALVVPNSNTSTAGGNTFLGPITNSTRIYQWLIHENQLTAMVGSDLTGFSLRLPTNATAWPAADATFPSYEVFLGASVAPASRSLTFADNVASPQIQVRSGSLLVPANSYPIGGTTINDFGPEITFTNSYLYTGGHLLLEVRHTGSNTTTRTTEALGTSASGYGSNFSACWASSHTATTGLQGNFAVIQFSYRATLAVKFISFSAFLKNENTMLSWKAESLQNSKYFIVERSLDGSVFHAIGEVKIPANSSIETVHNFIDKNVSSISVPVIYYRLKVEEVTGQSSYSKVLAVKAAKNIGVSIFPNPVKDALNVSITTFNDEKMDYAIVNVNGQRMDNGIFNLLKGSNVVSIDIMSLPKGVYTLLLHTPNEKKQVRFLKE